MVVIIRFFKNLLRIVTVRKPVYRVKAWRSWSDIPGSINYVTKEQLDWLFQNDIRNGLRYFSLRGWKCI